MQVADKLFSSFGQDILDALYWTATEPRGRKREHLGLIPHLCFSLVYVCILFLSFNFWKLFFLHFISVFNYNFQCYFVSIYYLKLDIYIYIERSFLVCNFHLFIGFKNFLYIYIYLPSSSIFYCVFLLYIYIYKMQIEISFQTLIN